MCIGPWVGGRGGESNDDQLQMTHKKIVKKGLHYIFQYYEVIKKNIQKVYTGNDNEKPVKNFENQHLTRITALIN